MTKEQINRKAAIFLGDKVICGEIEASDIDILRLCEIAPLMGRERMMKVADLLDKEGCSDNARRWRKEAEKLQQSNEIKQEKD